MAVVCEIINLVVCWKIHGCGCVADDSPREKSMNRKPMGPCLGIVSVLALHGAEI